MIRKVKRSLQLIGNRITIQTIQGFIPSFLFSGEEDDAVLHTFNTECAVRRIKWFGRSNMWGYMACFNHNEDLQLWTRAEVNPIAIVDRKKVSQGLMVSSFTDKTRSAGDLETV